MDSEHRHELAENDLARILKGFGSKFEGYGGPLVAGAVALIAVVLGFSVIRGQAAATTKEAWRKLGKAQVADNCVTVAEEYPDTEVAAWARVNAGRLFLGEGIRQSFSDTDAAKDSLQRAKDEYELALKNPVAPDEVKARALFGLATVAEATSGADTSDAIAAYELVLSTYPEAPSRMYAEQRIERLKSKSGQQFYAWLSEQNLSPDEAPASPFDSILGGDDGPAPPPTPMEEAAEESDPGTNPFESIAPNLDEDNVGETGANGEPGGSESMSEESSSPEESTAGGEPAEMNPAGEPASDPATPAADPGTEQPEPASTEPAAEKPEPAGTEPGTPSETPEPEAASSEEGS